MTIACDPDPRPIGGRAFEDILDGYFPLRESVRQLLQRQGFKAMWITLLHAPIMNIKGLPPDAPVPMHLRKIYSGMIDHMLLVACTSAEGMTLAGSGDWFFSDKEEDTDVFPDLIRLGEPAFVRGIGILDADPWEGETAEAAALALIGTDGRAPAGQAAASLLGWQDARAFSLGAMGQGICRQAERDSLTLPFGSEPGASQTHPHDWPLPRPGFLPPADWLLVNASSGAMDRDALEVVERL